MRYFLKASWLVLAKANGGVLLGSEFGAIWLGGPEAVSFVERLTSSGIDDQEHGSAAAFLAQLRSGRALRPTPAEQSASVAYRELAGLEFNEPVSVELRNLYAPADPCLREYLAESGILTEADGPFLVVTTNDVLRPEIAAIAREEARPWLLARITGREIAVGPLFKPGEHPCWFCFAHWIRTRRWLQSSLFGWDEDDCPPQPVDAFLPSTIATAVNMIRLALQSSHAGSGGLRAKVRTFDTAGLKIAQSIVRVRGSCSYCGGIEGGADPPPDLMDWADRYTGIVHSLHVAPNANGFYHAAARFYQPLPLRGARPLIRPGAAFGHGQTQDAAEIRCMAEVLERSSAVFRGNERMLRGKLETIDAIPPEALLLFSERQYSSRDVINSAELPPHQVPVRFDPEADIDWCAASSLRDGRVRHVPAALCYLWYPTVPEHAFATADTNGLAAGATQTACLLHAILELIERDSLAIWWYNRLRRPGIDLDSFDDPGVHNAIAGLRNQSRIPVLLDLTSDLKIPVFAAIAPLEDGSEPYFGCAAHPDAATAAIKAIGEMEQIRFWSAQSQPPPEYAEWLAAANAHRDLYLQPERFEALPKPEKPRDAVESLDLCLDRLAKSNLDPFALEMTRPEYGLKVWRVFVPGLRHCWKRLAPGRLYDVPVNLGWRTEPLREEDLNPLGCPL